MARILSAGQWSMVRTKSAAVVWFAGVRKRVTTRSKSLRWASLPPRGDKRGRLADYVEEVPLLSAQVQGKKPYPEFVRDDLVVKGCILVQGQGAGTGKSAVDRLDKGKCADDLKGLDQVEFVAVKGVGQGAGDAIVTTKGVDSTDLRFVSAGDTALLVELRQHPVVDTGIGPTIDPAIETVSIEQNLRGRQDNPPCRSE